MGMTTGHHDPILVIEHIDVEHLGRIGHALGCLGLSIETIRTWQKDPIPSEVDRYSAVIIMGGPMSVYEMDTCPHLRDEVRLIESAIMQHKPFLGVCLGAQLLAQAAGGHVYPRGQSAIGWYRMRTLEACREDKLWKSAPPEFTALKWHRDYYRLPSGAVSLVESEDFSFEAFKVDETAYGLLFHIEVSAHMVAQWVNTFGYDKSAGTELVTEAISIERDLWSLTDSIVYSLVGRGPERDRDRETLS